MKQGVKTNLVDAAMKDSGISGLLYGARTLRKVFERLYQDALDRMIRSENRVSKYIKTQQQDLLSVLHTVGIGTLRLPQILEFIQTSTTIEYCQG